MARRVLGAVTGGLIVLLAASRARAWFPVRVAGPSMAPTLQPGDLLAARPLRDGEHVVGQIVVARVDGREVVKRVAPRPGIPPGTVWLVGDDPTRSTDSRTTGPVRVDEIVGVVRFRYWPLGRAGRVPLQAGAGAGAGSVTT